MVVLRGEAEWSFYGVQWSKIIILLLVVITVRHSQAGPIALFTDQAAAAGLTIPNISGTEQRYIVEGMMGGGRFF